MNSKLLTKAVYLIRLADGINRQLAPETLKYALKEGVEAVIEEMKMLAPSKKGEGKNGKSKATS